MRLRGNLQNEIASSFAKLTPRNDIQQPRFIGVPKPVSLSIIAFVIRERYFSRHFDNKQEIMMQSIRNYVNGQFKDAENTGFINVENPSTG